MWNKMVSFHLVGDMDFSWGLKKMDKNLTSSSTLLSQWENILNAEACPYQFYEYFFFPINSSVLAVPPSPLDINKHIYK